MKLHVCFGTQVPFSGTYCNQGVRDNLLIYCYCYNSGFGGLEVACWPLVPKLGGFAPRRRRQIFRAKKFSACHLFRRGSKAVGHMS
jgi:hypothetical protein